ncbi:DegT/DnrJ/EryC1/StrS family aminotransferase [Actinoallomurus acaciae]|uniref:DegT/DnrJ/EryC1/StrS family aminotransferase n=1 Tax=Actinoallomurus acaciae TaxID=502577 RepID=A0ABV5YIV6_9ACTN
MHDLIPVARPALGEEEIAAAVRVMRSGRLVQGPEVAAFEDEFAALVAGRHCVALNSGTSALWLILLALGITTGDEVILPAFTFAAAAAVIRLTGATPVFADIDPATFCLDPDAVTAVIGRRTAAVMPVHLYGQPADMGALVAITQRHGLALIEDAAQGHGAAWDGRPVGTFGTAAGFSFYPTKNMFTIGGGMVTTGDAGLARKLRLLRDQGSQTRYVHEIVGTNARMSDVAAAIGREQLRKLPAFTRSRRRNAAYLDAALKDVVGTPAAAAAARHVYHQYTIRVPDDGPARDQAADRLRARGIATEVYYPTPLHRQPAFRCEVDLPRTDAAARQVLSLPVHPGLIDTDLARITSAVTGVFARDLR